MTIPEESRSVNPAVPAGVWHRRVLQAPALAAWVPGTVDMLAGQPAMPALRGLQTEPGGGWSVEEFVAADRLPLTAYLTNSAAPVWVFVSIVQQCLTGLIALHQCGLWHGAICPRTLLVDPSGQVVLAGCGAAAEAPEWGEGLAGLNQAPPLPQSLAAADLRDLGRVFRGVLGGDPDVKMTTSRPDIAPLVAEWIDWLADPAPGREPAGAAQAETIFTEIRTGRAGWRPWRVQSELPPEIGEHQSPALTEEERIRLARRFRLGHGTGSEWGAPLLFGTILLALLAGGAWVLHHFVTAPAEEKALPADVAAEQARAGPILLKDEDPALFMASGGDTEPVPETAAAIEGLMEATRAKGGIFPDWAAELQRQREARGKAAKAETAPPGTGVPWLSDPLIFPPIGKPATGRGPADYYLVWRTRNIVLTVEESRTLQSAILRTARYCGVRVLAWTVLPNQAAAVLRVPERQPLTDEKLHRRIAILRGENTAVDILAKVNAKLKDGDPDGAEQKRREWTASMGSVEAFFTVIKTVPIVPKEVLGGAPLWQAAAVYLSVLDPDTLEVLQAAGIVDTASVRSRMAESPSAWPTCSLTAAMLNYGPALRAVSVLMQRNPQASRPLPSKEELLGTLSAYRRYTGDLPPEKPAPATPPPPASGAEPPPPPAGH